MNSERQTLNATSQKRHGLTRYAKAYKLSAKLNALINSLNREDSGLRR
jgi:predicted transcriptional regulator